MAGCPSVGCLKKNLMLSHHEHQIYPFKQMKMRPRTKRERERERKKREKKENSETDEIPSNRPIYFSYQLDPF